MGPMPKQNKQKIPSFHPNKLAAGFPHVVSAGGVSSIESTLDLSMDYFGPSKKTYNSTFSDG